MVGELLSIDLLGKHYDLPKDILVYLSEHHCFEEYRQEMLTFFVANYSDYQNLPTPIEQLTFDKFRYYGDLCAKKLIAQDIFDVTADDLVGILPEKCTWKTCMDASVNDGMKVFYDGLKETMSERLKALIDQTNSFLNQAQDAELVRDSKITGTGFGIITNSIVGYGVWAAMESSSIKKQSAAANAEFSRDIDNIQKGLESRSAARLSRFEREVWIPCIQKSVDLFIINLFKKYIDVLIEHGKFDKEALSHIDIAKSQSILKNIGTTDNKAGILDAAFLSCPFNPEFYDIAIESCDAAEVIACAKIFSVDENLQSGYTQICTDIALNKELSEEEVTEKISPYISAISMIVGDSKEAVCTQFIEAHRSVVKKAIIQVSSDWKTASDSNLKSMIRMLTGKPVAELEGMDDSELKDAITKKVISESFGAHIPSPFYDETISQTSDEIFTIVKRYIDKCAAAKQNYLSKQAQYEEGKKQSEEEIAKINEEIKSLGLFAFSKKKELNARIADINLRIADLRETSAAAEREYRALI